MTKIIYNEKGRNSDKKKKKQEDKKWTKKKDEVLHAGRRINVYRQKREIPEYMSSVLYVDKRTK